MGSPEYTKSSNEIVAVICPKCGKLHKIRIFFTGKGELKKMCSSCKQSVFVKDYWRDNDR